MSYWITLAESNLQASLSGSEIEAFKTAALAEGQADPVAELLARITLHVRGYVAAGKWRMGPDGTVPPTLARAAVALCVMDVMSRPAAAVIDDEAGTRAKAGAAAQRTLEAAAGRGMTVEDPDTGLLQPIENTVQGGHGASVLSSRPNTVNSQTMKGL